MELCAAALKAARLSRVARDAGGSQPCVKRFWLGHILYMRAQAEKYHEYTELILNDASSGVHVPSPSQNRRVFLGGKKKNHKRNRAGGGSRSSASASHLYTIQWREHAEPSEHVRLPFHITNLASDVLLVLHVQRFWHKMSHQHPLGISKFH